jgi:predicted permease
MTPLFRKVKWWLERGRREADLRAELEFHLEEETDERRAQGLSPEAAAQAARRDLGNPTIVKEDARALWSWIVFEQAAQDIRYAVRGMAKTKTFTLLAATSLALGIGANSAICSFMDAILLRALPVSDPDSLAVVKWRSVPGTVKDPAVIHSMDGQTFDDDGIVVGAIFPFPAFEALQGAAAPVLSTLFAYKPAGTLNVAIDGRAELGDGEYVSGDFFHGLAVGASAGRLILNDDDRFGAAPVAVISLGYSQRRFGDASSAIGRSISINGAPFIVIGVTPAEFFGVDPGAAPDIYLPMHSAVPQREVDSTAFTDDHYFWLEMMGRLKPGVTLVQARAALAPAFAQWVASTAATADERATLPVLRLAAGGGGLDSLRRQYSRPLFVLLTMVGLILAIACANTANLLLARATARAREMAVRLSLGAGRWRLVRQLLTESLLLAALSGAFGIVVAVGGVQALTGVLANGASTFRLHATVNWHVLLVALALSVLCSIVFGLAPALRATRVCLMPGLRGRAVTEAGVRLSAALPRLRLTQLLVVAQIATSLVLLVAAGLFVRTLSNLQSIPLGFNRENVLLFEVDAPRAGYPASGVVAFYAGLRERLSGVPGVLGATLSHSSLIRAGRAHPIVVNGRTATNTRVLWMGPRVFSTMQIPIVRGREILERDHAGAPRAVVISESFNRLNFGRVNAVGRHLQVGGSLQVDGAPLDFEIVGVAADAHYGDLKRTPPPVVYLPYEQVPARQLGGMTYALRTDGDPLRSTAAVRQVVSGIDARVPVANVRTAVEDVDETINQEVVFAKLCTAFAILALAIACVGLYATMSYVVARRTSEIGIRMALGADRWTVTWNVLREVCLLAAAGLAVAVPIAMTASRLIQSFLFDTKPNDPGTMAVAAALLLAAVLAAGYGPARRASRVDPIAALRHD